MKPHSSPPCPLPPGFTSAALPLRVRFGAHEATLRWLQPDDTGRLIEFFASHSEETVRQRYGYARVQMTPDQAARLVSVDQSRDAALGVIEEQTGTARLIAIGRYCLAPDGWSAETAFVVHEQRRGLGIGTTLLAALIAIARERHLQKLVGQVAHDNAAMLHVFGAAGATFGMIPGAAATLATIGLEQKKPAAERPKTSRRRSRRSTAPTRRPRIARSSTQPRKVRLRSPGAKPRRSKPH